MSLGMGVLLNYLGGNEKTVNAVSASLNKIIKSVGLESDELIFVFDDDSRLILWDDGQSCCESRYMMTDDDLSYYTGSVLQNFELKESPTIEAEYGDHEVLFLDVKTSKGVFQMASHNEHNGYYGGFSIKARLG